MKLLALALALAAASYAVTPSLTVAHAAPATLARLTSDDRTKAPKKKIKWRFTGPNWTLQDDLVTFTVVVAAGDHYTVTEMMTGPHTGSLRTLQDRGLWVSAAPGDGETMRACIAVVQREWRQCASIPAGDEPSEDTSDEYQFAKGEGK